MSDDTDPGTKKRQNWADKIPLVTLLAVVFAAGVLYAQQRAISDKLDTFAQRQFEDHDRIVKLETLAALKAAGP